MNGPRLAIAVALLAASACGASDYTRFTLKEMSPKTVGLQLNVTVDGRVMKSESYSLDGNHGDTLTLGLVLPHEVMGFVSAITFDVNGCAVERGVAMGRITATTRDVDLVMERLPSSPDCALYATPLAAHRVRVPPVTDFVVGCTPNAEPLCGKYSVPRLSISLPAFDIDFTEVTGAAYANCIAAGKCTKSELPSQYDIAQLLTWDQAKSYCAWAGGRLPTEVEWERVARHPDGRFFPWGNQAPDCMHARFSGCVSVPGIVASQPLGKSALGLYDLAGNVAEWTLDTGVVNGETLVVTRGGNYESPAESLNTTQRVGWASTEILEAGARCVSDVN